jgi:hypothetical protein
MSLAEVQGAFARVCFDTEPREEDLALLYAPRERWLMYRHMVRARLFQMIKNGLPKSAEVVGPARFDAAIGRYLAEHGPRTRFIREIVGELVRFALPIWERDPEVPGHAVDLVRFEDAKWRAASAPIPELALDAFDFERVPEWNPTLEVLEVSHRVDKNPIDPPRLPLPCTLLVFRKPETTNTWAYGVSGTGAALVRAWRSGVSCADGARQVLEGRTPDAKFIDELATVLAELVEQKMILGSRR